MSIRTLRFKAGVVKDETELGAQPYWSDSDRIRFVRDRVQKIGGWDAWIDDMLNGVCRAALAWRDSSSTRRVAFGTHKRLQVEEGGDLFDITPIRATSEDLSDPFAVTIASAVVTVTDATHGAAVGDGIIVANATAGGGITIDGAYEITAVIDADTYQIVHSSPATSTDATTGGAGVDIQYQVSVGREHAIEGFGYGVGGYGGGTYGTARTSGLVLPPRVWSLDTFGEDLIAAVREGSIYRWELDTDAAAALLTNAPTPNIGAFVTEEQHIVALGAGGDNMVVQWCSQGAPTTWTPAVTNTAGSRTLTGGNKAYQGLRIRGTNLILCDASVWTMTFIGGLDVFGFHQHAGGTEGGISQNCGVVVDGIAYWMAQKSFRMFDGVVRPIPRENDIKQFVFENIQTSQQEKVYAFYMSQYSEIWFFYPVDQENSRYVKVNLGEKYAWDVGSLVRTAAIDAGLLPTPLMIHPGGTIYEHETGMDDDGSAMNEFVKSAPIEISDGDRLMELMGLIADVKDIAGVLEVTVFTREYPQDSEVTSAVYEIESDTGKVDMRESGRQAAFKFGSSGTGTDWRLGEIKPDLQPLGQH